MSRIVGLAFGLLLAAGGVLIVTGAQKPGSEVCKASDVDLPGLTGDDSIDGHALSTYRQTIAQLFQDEKFEQLDCEMLIRVSKEGGIEQVLTNPSTPVSDCLMQSLVEFQVAKATPFPEPPTPSYWLRLDLDPATVPQVTGNSSKP